MSVIEFELLLTFVNFVAAGFLATLAFAYSLKTDFISCCPSLSMLTSAAGDLDLAWPEALWPRPRAEPTWLGCEVRAV